MTTHHYKVTVAKAETMLQEKYPKDWIEKVDYMGHGPHEGTRLYLYYINGETHAATYHRDKREFWFLHEDVMK